MDHRQAPSITDLVVSQVIGCAVVQVAGLGIRAHLWALRLLWVFSVVTVGVMIVAGFGALPVASTAVLWVSAAPLVAAVVQLVRAVRTAPAGVTRDRLDQYAVWPISHIINEFRNVEPVLHQATHLQQQSAFAVHMRRALHASVRAALLGGTGMVLAAGLAVVS